MAVQARMEALCSILQVAMTQFPPPQQPMLPLSYFRNITQVEKEDSKLIA